MMEFKDTGLPSVQPIVNAFRLVADWGLARHEMERAVQSARVLAETMPQEPLIPTFIGAHLVAHAMSGHAPLSGLWRYMDATLHIPPYMKELAEELQARHLDGVDLRPVEGLSEGGRISGLASATAHLEWLMKEYGGATAESRTQRFAPGMMDDCPEGSPVADLLRKRVKSNRDVIDWVGTTGEAALEERYVRALEAVEKKLGELEPKNAFTKAASAPAPGPAQPAMDWHAYHTQRVRLGRRARDPYTGLPLKK